MENTTAEQPTVETGKAPKRLAGSYTVTVEDAAEIQKQGAWRARARLLSTIRLATMAGVAAITVVGVLTWQDLGRKHFAASEPLKYIGIQYELQRMEILRYAPFHDRHERQLSRRLDAAMGELSSADLGARVTALHEIRAILGPRKVKSLRTMVRDYPQLKETFEINLEDSDIAVSELCANYEQAAKKYNSAARSISAVLVRQLVGMPDKLPPFKN